MKPSAMKGIFFLWTLHIASVTSLEIKPFSIWEFSMPVSGRPKPRIYGETKAKEGEYPFMIFTLYKTEDGSRSYCSASLLTDNWVLTAAHCVGSHELQPHNIILVGGKADLNDYAKERFLANWNESVNEAKLGVEERRAQAIYIHPGYISSTDAILHDVALIKPEKPFTAAYVKTIPLSLDKIYNKKTCTILGWGSTLVGYDNYQLNAVREKEISTTNIGCKYVTDRPLICLKSDGLTGICTGDSGSPLVCNGMVWGVASYLLTFSRNCSDSLEEYYTELSAEKTWIQSILKNGSRAVKTDFVGSFVFVCAALRVTGNIFK